MKVVRMSEARFQKDAEDQHGRLLEQHEARVREIEALNKELLEAHEDHVNAMRVDEHKHHALADKIEAEVPDLPHEVTRPDMNRKIPEPLLSELPPEPEPVDDFEPEVWDAKLIEDEPATIRTEWGDGQVQPPVWVLKSERSEYEIAVQPADFERDWQEV